MSFLRRFHDERDERTLAALAVAVRATVEPPPEHLGADLVPRLAQTVLQEAPTRALQEERTGNAKAAQRRPARASRRRSRFGPVLRIAAAVALLPAVFASLAVAGVKLPDQAVSAFDAVGVELPNQGGGEEGSGAGAGGDGDSAESAKPNKAKNGKAKKNGDAPAGAGPGDDVVPPIAEERSDGKAGGNASIGKRGNGKAHGRNGTAFGHQPGVPGQGKAVGKGAPEPPGQANKPSTPPADGQSGGQSQAGSEVKGGQQKSAPKAGSLLE